MWLVRGAPARSQSTLFLSEEPLLLRTPLAPELYFSAVQDFSLVFDAELNQWRVRTHAYAYWVHTLPQERYGLLNWHWHPPERARPHFHLSAQIRDFGDIRDFHIPSGRVSFEEVVRFLIEDLRVRPQRDDWSAVLDRVESRFKKFRTWV